MSPSQRVFVGSLVLNLGLLGWIAYTITNDSHVSDFQARETLQPPPVTVQAQPLPAPFRWRELEATDFPTYIANLRKIGCPERTIRDLLTAEVKRLPAPDGTSPAIQSVLLLEWLGPDPEQTFSENPADTTGAELAAAGREQPALQTVNDTPISMALALLPAPAKLQLPPAQLTALTALRDEFIKAVGGANQNPDDPDYRRRWTAAQPEFDERFRALFGEETHGLQQSLAAQSPR